MTKSQTPEPAVTHTPAPRDRELPTDGSLAKKPTSPQPQSESKPRRFFKVRTDHH